MVITLQLKIIIITFDGLLHITLYFLFKTIRMQYIRKYLRQNDFTTFTDLLVTFNCAKKALFCFINDN